MLYIRITSKNKRDGVYVKFENNVEARAKYGVCAMHRKSSTASRVELVTSTGEIIASHDYE